ncbi:MAG TPA: hypothetical protein DDX19_19790 [Rhodopirellula baltica]|uniref:DUF998 domain-containing protein n=1 Tax=Rhodopirellula baltica TaxID=265606 RepID=UPI000E8F6BDD|nr:DUF998 domain-containing protein [Rhodopirellula baltica]HBE64950.1 hypothetical protein [Rhodopirellula baltica]
MQETLMSLSDSTSPPNDSSATMMDRLVLSYLDIRRAIGLSGLVLPLVLGPGGMLLGIEIQENMSSYYHTPLRDVFVGTLCAIGIFLFCYRGYDRIENWTANIGAVAAIGIALFPLDYGSDPLIQKSFVGYVHTFSGGVFFTTLAFYSLYHFPRDSKREAESHLFERSMAFRASGLTILLITFAMGGYMLLVPQDWKDWLNGYNFLFWAEWIAVWSFASSWLAKGRIIVTEIGVEVLAYSRKMVLQHGLGIKNDP